MTAGLVLCFIDKIIDITEKIFDNTMLNSTYLWKKSLESDVYYCKE